MSDKDTHDISTNIPPNEEHKGHNAGNNIPRDESPTNTMKTTIATDGLTANGLVTGCTIGVGNTPRFTTKSWMEDDLVDLPLSTSVVCNGFRVLLSLDMDTIRQDSMIVEGIKTRFSPSKVKETDQNDHHCVESREHLLSFFLVFCVNVFRA